MQQKNDITQITRGNLNAEIFNRVVSDENIWLDKDFCQWKVELLWWLINQGNLSVVRQNQIDILLNRFADETVPAYFSLILEMIIFFPNDLPNTTIELAINVINNKTISIDTDEHKILFDKINELPDHFKNEVNNLLNNVQPHAPSKSNVYANNIADLITPDNITILTALVSSVIGITTATIKGIKLWLDERASRKIRIKHEGFEVEINGYVSEEDICKKLAIAKKIREEITKDSPSG